jgi:hypothetical protein
MPLYTHFLAWVALMSQSTLFSCFVYTNTIVDLVIRKPITILKGSDWNIFMFFVLSPVYCMMVGEAYFFLKECGFESMEMK